MSQNITEFNIGFIIYKHIILLISLNAFLCYAIDFYSHNML